MPPENIQPASASNGRTWQRCVASLGCPALTVEEFSALANEFKINLLELRALENRVDLPALLSERSDGWAGVKTFLDELSLTTRVLGTSFKLVGNNESQWNELCDFAVLADALQTPYLRAFGGGSWGVPLADDDYRSAATTLKRWNTVRNDRGWNVQLLIETHDAFSASAPFLRLINHFDSPVELIWDTHHTWRLGGESPTHTWEKLKPFVRHVHFKDSINIPSPRHPYTYVLPGEGEMPLEEVFVILRQDLFQGGVSLEWEKMWHPYLAPLADALEACRGLDW